jgi:predicted transcriptional regulator of viral defense system
VTQAQAHAVLARFPRPVVSTDEAGARLRMSRSAVSRLLGRLAVTGLVVKIRHGVWATRSDIDPLALPEYLTAPYPSYVSLYTALYHHGMPSQVPRRIFVASLGRTRLVRTTLATFSVHRIAPELLGGFRDDPRSGVKMATPEKALVDTLYLARARSGLFSRLPEIEIPAGFDRAEAWRWVARVRGRAHRAMVERRLVELLPTSGWRRTPPVPARRRRRPVARRD